MLQVFIRQRTVLGIDCKVWVAEDHSVTCVGRGCEPPSDCHRWFQVRSEILAMNHLLPELLRARGAHSASAQTYSRKKAAEAKSWRHSCQRYCRSHTCEDALLEGLSLERTYPMPKAGHLWRVHGLRAAQVIVSVGDPCWVRDTRKPSYRKNLKKPLICIFKIFLRCKLVDFLQSIKNYFFKVS